MKPVLIAGTSIVNLALISYSIGILTEQRKKRLSNKVLGFVSLGLFFDITATTLMIIGSENTPYTLHGIIGYSSLLGMMTDAFLLWRFSMRHGKEAGVSRSLHWYTRIAYVYWLCAYVTGALIVALK